MNDNITKDDLNHLLKWAQEKTHDDGQPPWAWYQYMKLVETVESILKGMDSISPKVNSQQSVSHPERHLRLVDAKYQQDTAQHHQDIEGVPLPM